jgi:hypothetical protein
MQRHLAFPLQAADALKSAIADPTALGFRCQGNFNHMIPSQNIRWLAIAGDDNKTKIPWTIQRLPELQAQQKPWMKMIKIPVQRRSVLRLHT